jgi:hypothetical protein
MRHLVVVVLTVLGLSLACTPFAHAWNSSATPVDENNVEIPIIIKSPFKSDDPAFAGIGMQMPLSLLYTGDPKLGSSIKPPEVTQDNVGAKEPWYASVSPGIYQVTPMLFGAFFIKSITSGNVDLMPDTARLVVTKGVKPEPIVIVLDEGADLKGTTKKNGKSVAARIFLKGPINVLTTGSQADPQHPQDSYAYEFSALQAGNYQICAVYLDEYEEARHLLSSSLYQPAEWCREVKSLSVPEHGKVTLDLEVQHFKGSLQAMAAKEAPAAPVDSAKAPVTYGIMGTLSHDAETLLLARNFDRLESTANELRRTKAKFPNGGYPKLDNFYEGLSAISERSHCLCGNYKSSVPFETKRDLLQKWMEAQPKLLTARIAIAELWMNYAWYARGSGYANNITPEDWKLYFERLKTGGDYLKGIDPKDDPYVYMEYSQLIELTPSPRKALDAVYVAAVENYPDFFPIYLREARMLEEKWFGRPGEIAAFMLYLLQSPGGKNGQIAFAYVATYRAPTEYGLYRKQVFEKMGLPWPLFRDAYKTKEKQYGLSEEDWNALWVYCIAANDGAAALDIIQHVRQVAERGDVGSQINLGMAYQLGLGVEKNPKEAMNWYRLAADQGNSTAKNNIGVLFENGLGVPQDYNKAAWWYQTAADQGNARAEFHIGLMYYKGFGTQRNEGLAYEWMRAASKGGEGEATQWLAQHPQQNSTP